MIGSYLQGEDEYLTAMAVLALAENRGAEALDLLLATLEQVSKEIT